MDQSGCFPAAFIAVALMGVAFINPPLALASAAALAVTGFALATLKRLRSTG